jgi:hypothetical protein
MEVNARRGRMWYGLHRNKLSNGLPVYRRTVICDAMTPLLYAVLRHVRD